MNVFRFPLQKALELRRRQLELEEARYRQRLAEVAALEQEQAETEAAGSQAHRDVPQWKPVSGQDLASLDRFRLRVKSESARIAGRRAEAERIADQQQTVM